MQTKNSKFIEIDKLDYRAVVLPETKKISSDILQKILEKIKKTKNEPFGRFYVIGKLNVLEELKKFLGQNNIRIKSISSDKINFMVEF